MNRIASLLLAAAVIFIGTLMAVLLYLWKMGALDSGDADRTK